MQKSELVNFLSLINHNSVFWGTLLNLSPALEIVLSTDKEKERHFPSILFRQLSIPNTDLKVVELWCSGTSQDHRLDTRQSFGISFGVRLRGSLAGMEMSLLVDHVSNSALGVSSIRCRPVTPSTFSAKGSRLAAVYHL